MGNQQLLLSIAAISLLGIILINTYRWMIDQNDDMLQKEFEFYSISLAQSFIEEAKTKAFDENAVNGSPASPADFTPWDQLGPEGESYEVSPRFDDIDDFHDFGRTDSSRSTFEVSISVGYVEPTSPDSVVSYETYYKRISVSVTNKYLDQPVQLGYVFGYIKN